MADARNDLDSLAHTSRDLHAALHRDAPLVQCLTNFVSMNYAANVLLAAGASPAMVHAAEEAPEFSRISGAVVINIGTLSQPWLDSMLLTAQAASQASVPWVLDPVAHHATAFRRDAVRRLLALKPAIIRGNASEIIALAGGASAGRGVDAGDPVAQAEQSARELALAQETVVAVTGEVDYVTDGHRAVRIAGGDALMPRVTATGCALTALTGAFAAVAGQAADSAGSRQAPAQPVPGTMRRRSPPCPASPSPAAAPERWPTGSFAWRFLDALAALRPDDLVTESPLRRDPASPRMTA